MSSVKLLSVNLTFTRPMTLPWLDPWTASRDSTGPSQLLLQISSKAKGNNITEIDNCIGKLLFHA